MTERGVYVARGEGGFILGRGLGILRRRGKGRERYKRRGER